MLHTMNYQHDRMATRPEAVPVLSTAYRRRRQGPYPAPFDPNELSRRLYAVVADRRIQDLKKGRVQSQLGQDRSPSDVVHYPSTSVLRKSNIPKAVSPDDSDDAEGSPYKLQKRPRFQADNCVSGKLKKPPPRNEKREGPRRGQHVPGMAAMRHTRATAIDGTDDRVQTQRPSEPTVRPRIDGLDINGRNLAMAAGINKPTPIESAHRIWMAQAEKERQREHSQFRQPAILGQVVDQAGAQGREARRYTFETHTRSQSSTTGARPATRQSNMSSPSERPHSGAAIKSTATQTERQRSCNNDGHRGDWTQSNEDADNPGHTQSLILQKSASKWALKARLGRAKKQQPEPPKATSTGDSTMETITSPELPKSALSVFFSRFRR